VRLRHREGRVSTMGRNRISQKPRFATTGLHFVAGAPSILIGQHTLLWLQHSLRFSVKRRRNWTPERLSVAPQCWTGLLRPSSHGQYD